MATKFDGSTELGHPLELPLYNRPLHVAGHTSQHASTWSNRLEEVVRKVLMAGTRLNGTGIRRCCGLVSTQSPLSMLSVFNVTIGNNARKRSYCTSG